MNISGYRRAAALCAALAIVCGCSKSVGPSIIGHWHAERVAFDSVQLPVGLYIVVSNTQIVSPDTGASLPIKGIEGKKDAVTIDLSYGVGFTFYFDGPDRMYLKIPLVGPIYYRRVVEDVHASALPANIAETSANGLGSATQASELSKQSADVEVKRREPKNVNAEPSEVIAGAPRYSVGQSTVSPSVGMDKVVTGGGAAQAKLALVAAHDGDYDAAISRLGDAFKSGYRGFAFLDSAPELSGLRGDVRYRALVARYR
ncbi:hypothetical protein P0D69_38580 [Paraburkholderia sediminicola]|uniref:hypothetical protein n=1 Tax=Paraburkholderia sediminicola TaxID=458836 RepID=UPI0038B9BF97